MSEKQFIRAVCICSPYINGTKVNEVYSSLQAKKNKLAQQYHNNPLINSKIVEILKNN